MLSADSVRNIVSRTLQIRLEGAEPAVSASRIDAAAERLAATAPSLPPGEMIAWLLENIAREQAALSETLH